METLNALIAMVAQTPQRLDDDDISALRRLARDYPASALAPALLLKWADDRLSDSERDAYRRRVALTSGDRVALINYIDPDGAGFDTFYPAQPVVSKPATTSAIDTFLETYGHRSAEEDALLERMIFNPVPDYSEQLAREEAQGKSTAATSGKKDSPLHGQDELIDAFLRGNHEPSQRQEQPQEQPIQQPQAPTPTRPQTPARPQPQAQGLLSESLAKIFIKQGRYERAYEIISNLNLNYPEKSVYFADQLRFLRKLMINQRYAPKSQE